MGSLGGKICDRLFTLYKLKLEVAGMKKKLLSLVLTAALAVTTVVLPAGTQAQAKGSKGSGWKAAFSKLPDKLVVMPVKGGTVKLDPFDFYDSSISLDSDEDVKVEIKSSNPKVMKVKVSHSWSNEDDCNLYDLDKITILKPGKATLSITLKKDIVAIGVDSSGVETSKIETKVIKQWKSKITVKKYENPFSKFSVGGNNLVSYFGAKKCSISKPSEYWKMISGNKQKCVKVSGGKINFQLKKGYQLKKICIDGKKVKKGANISIRRTYDNFGVSVYFTIKGDPEKNVYEAKIYVGGHNGVVYG